MDFRVSPAFNRVNLPFLVKHQKKNRDKPSKHPKKLRRRVYSSLTTGKLCRYQSCCGFADFLTLSLRTDTTTGFRWCLWCGFCTQLFLASESASSKWLCTATSQLPQLFISGTTSSTLTG